MCTVGFNAQLNGLSELVDRTAESKNNQRKSSTGYRQSDEYFHRCISPFFAVGCWQSDTGDDLSEEFEKEQPKDPERW